MGGTPKKRRFSPAGLRDLAGSTSKQKGAVIKAAPPAGMKRSPLQGLPHAIYLETAARRVDSYAPPQVQEASPAAGFHNQWHCTFARNSRQKCGVLGNSSLYFSTPKSETQGVRNFSAANPLPPGEAACSCVTFGIFRKRAGG